MSRYRRSHAQGATFFFTVNTHHRQPILVEDEVRAALREAITRTRNEQPFKIHAWVLLPDHLHCIWELPPGDAEFGTRWGKIKSFVSRQCGTRAGLHSPRSASREKRHESLLWQRRFWEHQIRDDRDFERHVDYIHWNPIKHGHVSRVMDWPYSTFHRYLKQGIYTEDWGAGNPEGTDDYSFGE